MSLRFQRMLVAIADLPVLLLTEVDHHDFEAIFTTSHLVHVLQAQASVGCSYFCPLCAGACVRPFHLYIEAHFVGP